MKRDLCYFLAADVDTVYNAFLTAAQNPPFERTCTQEHPYTFQFGLNFSMKYNMNGGAMTLRCIPYTNGTAVNLRFSIAQLAGARYEKYALDLLTQVTGILHIGFQPSNIPIEAFLEYAENEGKLPPKAPAAAPVIPAAPAPTPAPAVAPTGTVCVSCGMALNGNAKFCSQCGTPVQVKRFCTSCGAQISANAQFCSQCGTRL